jgi:hypothetical protein
MDAEGIKLAKRDSSDSLQMLREAGEASEQVIGRLSYELGLIERDEAVSLQALLENLRIEAGAMM